MELNVHAWYNQTFKSTSNSAPNSHDHLLHYYSKLFNICMYGIHIAPTGWVCLVKQATL